jgi:hypothetical protein
MYNLLGTGWQTIDLPAGLVVEGTGDHLDQALKWPEIAQRSGGG